MDDRERIADCIAFHVWGCEVLCTEHRETAIRTADAVLAALGDRLLPEIPDDVYTIECDDRPHRHTGRRTGWTVRVSRRGKRAVTGERTQASRSTIAAAIRDAVGEAEGDDA